MRKIALVLALFVAAAGLALVAPAAVDAGAASTSDVFVVHGLNLDGQDEQGDGGTNVTVCTGDSPLVPNFQFGEVKSLGALTTGASVPVQVYLQPTPGTPVDCANPGALPILNETVTIEAGTVALVATSQESPPPPDLKQYVLNTDCVDPGYGRLTAAHAANAGTVDVLLDGELAGQIDYGELLDTDRLAGPVTVQVDLGATGTLVGPEEIQVVEANNRVIYVVGFQPVVNGADSDSAEPAADVTNTPVVALIQDLPLDTCETPTQPEPEPEPEAEQQPRVVRARPAFTG